MTANLPPAVEGVGPGCVNTHSPGDNRRLAIIGGANHHTEHVERGDRTTRPENRKKGNSILTR